MKTAIVTGSSSGFGKLIALELAKRGFEVIATMRNPDKADLLLKQAHDEKVENKISVWPLDVTLEESIKAFKLRLESTKHIDVLVNNAGYAQGGFCEELTIEDYRQQFETNFFGAIAVTQAVLPYMRLRRSGTIINMSSISGRFGFPGLSAYAASKHALEGFSESLRLEVKPFGIHVVLIEPGSYKTNIWENVGNVAINDESAYKTAMESLMSHVLSGKERQGDPLEVARLAAELASGTKEPGLRYPVGEGVRKMLIIKKLLPWGWIERIVLRKLKQR